MREQAYIVEEGRVFSQIFDDLEEWVRRRCAAELTAVDDETSVEAFVDELLDGLDAEVEQQIARRDRSLQTGFRDLAAGVRSSALDRCGASHPIEAAAIWARAATREWYSRARRAIDARIAQTSVCVTHSGSTCPKDAIPPWRLGGRTLVAADGDQPKVELEYGRAPDWQTFASAPYVMLHEFVSHVGRRAASSESWRPPMPSDPFAEGWMDVLAFKLHDLSVAGVGIDVPELDHWPDSMAAAGGLHAARRNQAGAARRAHGMDVAERFLGWLNRNVEEPFELFVRLSMDVNSSAISDERTAVFVWAMEEALVRERKGETLHDGRPLADWMSRYATTGDLTGLIERAEELVWSSFFV